MQNAMEIFGNSESDTKNKANFRAHGLQRKGQLENAMKRTCFYITMSLITATAPISATEINRDLTPCLIKPNAAICATTKLNLFVGPQSVEPGEPIYIAVEAANAGGGSGNSAVVVIVDTYSGREYRAEVENGLAQLQINAPDQAGRLTFVAKDQDIVSSEAEVLVHATKPAAFELVIEKEKDQVFVSSSIISDKFGNMIEDGQIAKIHLFDGKNVLASNSELTRAGRIAFRLKCSEVANDGAMLIVRLRDVKSVIQIPSYMCGG